MGRRIKTFQDIVKPVFPEADEDEAGYLVWNHTAYPFMGNDWRHYRKQLIALKKTLDAGHKPCEHCSASAVMNLRGDYKNINIYLCWNCFMSPIFDDWRERNEFSELIEVVKNDQMPPLSDSD